MFIRMKTLAAGPERVLVPDQVYKMPREEGQELVDGGYAVEVDRDGNTISVVRAGDPEPLDDDPNSGTTITSDEDPDLKAFGDPPADPGEPVDTTALEEPPAEDDTEAEAASAPRRPSRRRS